MAGPSLDRHSRRLLLALAAFLGLVLLVFRDEVVGPAMQPLQAGAAAVVGALLGSAGLPVARESAALFHPGGFAYQVSRGCLGLVPAGFLAVGILAGPGGARAKTIGVGLGVSLVLGLNLLRLLHLFYLGVHDPRAFHLAHEVFWEVAIVLWVVGLWLLWLRWADRARGDRVAGGPESV